MFSLFSMCKGNIVMSWISKVWNGHLQVSCTIPLWEEEDRPFCDKSLALGHKWLNYGWHLTQVGPISLPPPHKIQIGKAAT